MSRNGDCRDNAMAERFLKILKSVLVYHNRFRSKAHARLEIFEFIEIWYNRKRRHSPLGYLTPMEFEQNEILRKVA
jgi:putative transposase